MPLDEVIDSKQWHASLCVHNHDKKPSSMYFTVGLGRGGYVSANQFDALCTKFGRCLGDKSFGPHRDALIVEDYLITPSANQP